MRRLRVLRVITRLNVGGPAIQAAILSSRLNPERFETMLVAGHEDANEGSMLDLRDFGIAVVPVRIGTLGRELSVADDLRAFVDLLRIAWRFRPDIVHTHLAKAGVLGRIAGRLSGARVVVHTYHGSILREYFGSAETGFYRTIERCLAWITTKVIAITPLQRRELLELRIAPEDKIVMVPLGLDLEPFRDRPERPIARAALGIPVDVPLIGIVARLVPIKDVTTFLRALALVHARMPSVRALVVGDGEERDSLEALAKDLGLAEICTFTGWRADVQTIYGALDILALTSRNEGSPVSVIEAMAAGTAVVATAVGGVPDVVQDEVTGLLVAPRDAGAFAAALLRLLEDRPRLAALGAAAAGAVIPRYSTDRLVSDIEHLYLELSGEPA